MNIEEAHIKIDMDLQKVSTYTQRNLLPQEIDYFLNDEVIKFIKQRTSSRSNMKQLGTDKTTKRYEDLDDLTTIKVLDINVDGDGFGTCILPDNYHSYISSKTNVYQLCDNDVIATEAKSLYKCVFPLSFTTGLVLSTYTITFTNDSGSTVVFDLASLPTGYIQNVDINKQRFMLLKAIKILLKEALEALSPNTYYLYWEMFEESFYNNSFIVVSETPFTSITVNVNTTPIVYNANINSYNIYNKISLLWGENRLIEDEFQFSGGLSTLSKSRPDSLAIQLKQGVLKVEFPNTVICQKIKLMYIAKPTILDLALQKNLNMKDTVMKEIVSNTVRFLKGIFNGDYQTYLNENVMVE